MTSTITLHYVLKKSVTIVGMYIHCEVEVKVMEKVKVRIPRRVIQLCVTVRSYSQVRRSGDAVGCGGQVSDAVRSDGKV